MPRYEILPGLPGLGPLPLPFGAGGSIGGWSGHGEGFVVRFDPQEGRPWVGNFQPGNGSVGWEGVLEHPNGKDVIVVARGQGYVVDPEAQQLVSIISGYIEHVIRLPELGAVAIFDGLGIEAINYDGRWWRTQRISWDEIRNIKVEGTILRGEASTPDGQEWAPFTVDLMTGECKDGIYEETMRGAMRFKPSRD
jgi:hypothetical protein